MQYFDIHLVPAGADAALAVTDNPRHRHMLKNYRRHGLLEVSGFWKQILVPEMTVEQPRYILTAAGNRYVLDDMDSVAGFYANMTETGLNVGVMLGEHVAVSDYAIFSESRLAYVFRGDAPELAEDDVDPDRFYQVSTGVSMVWPYVDGRLAGEHVYEDTASRSVTEVDGSLFITPEQAREALAPLLAQSPEDELVEGLKLFS